MNGAPGGGYPPGGAGSPGAPPPPPGGYGNAPPGYPPGPVPPYGAPPGGYGAAFPPGVSPYGGPPSNSSQDPLAVASLIVGSASLLFAPCCGALSIMLGVVGLALGVVALMQSSAGDQPPPSKRLAIVGIVLSVLGPLAYVAMFVFFAGFSILSSLTK